MPIIMHHDSRKQSINSSNSTTPRCCALWEFGINCVYSDTRYNISIFGVFGILYIVDTVY